MFTLFRNWLFDLFINIDHKLFWMLFSTKSIETSWNLSDFLVIRLILQTNFSFSQSQISFKWNQRISQWKTLSRKSFIFIYHLLSCVRCSTRNILFSFNFFISPLSNNRTNLIQFFSKNLFSNQNQSNHIERYSNSIEFVWEMKICVDFRWTNDDLE